MSDKTPDFTPIQPSQAGKETTANRLHAAALTLFAIERTSGLVAYFIGGRFSGTHAAVDDLTMTDDDDNYVVAHRSTLALSVSIGTTNWNDSTTYGRVALITAAAGVITDWQDHRFGTGGIFPMTQTSFAGGTLTSALNYAAAATVASATTTDIGAASSNVVNITGTTTITGLGTIADGAMRFCIFAGALLLTHNATSLILPTAANITTAAGDVAAFVSKGSGNWKCLVYQRATGYPLRIPFVFKVAVTDETTAITTGTGKITFRWPFPNSTLTEVRGELNTVSSSGAPAVDVNEAGASIFSTTLTIDASEKTSVTAATPAVISDAAIADDAEVTVDIDTAGTGAKGLKLTFIGWRTV